MSVCLYSFLREAWAERAIIYFTGFHSLFFITKQTEIQLFTFYIEEPHYMTIDDKLTKYND